MGGAAPGAGYGGRDARTASSEPAEAPEKLHRVLAGVLRAAAARAPGTDRGPGFPRAAEPIVIQNRLQDLPSLFFAGSDALRAGEGEFVVRLEHGLAFFRA